MYAVWRVDLSWKAVAGLSKSGFFVDCHRDVFFFFSCVRYGGDVGVEMLTGACGLRDCGWGTFSGFCAVVRDEVFLEVY